LPARWVSGTLTGHATTPQTVGNPQPIVSFEYRVALVPAASAYVSNLSVSLLLANMDTQIFFRQNGIATAEYVQKRVGYKSEYAHSETTHEHKSGAESQSEQAVPLLPLDQITQLPDGEAIILHRNFKPIKAARMDFLRFPKLITLTEKSAPELPAIPAPLPISTIILDVEDDFPPRYGPRFTDDDRE
jgi:type IV secretory pathway TraG/TraD family ATPase VirD4